MSFQRHKNFAAEMTATMRTCLVFKYDTRHIHLLKLPRDLRRDTPTSPWIDLRNTLTRLTIESANLIPFVDPRPTQHLGCRQ